MNKDYDQQRMKLWCEVYVAYVASANSTCSDGAKAWADVALKRFDDRFKPEASPREFFKDGQQT